MKKNLNSIISALFVIAVTAMTIACAPGVPKEYIQPGEMEDILYDYHIAMAMAEQGNATDQDVRIEEYKQAVLKKHGCTDRQFTESLQYYMRHTERLHDIYESLAQRLDDEAKDLGAEGSNLNADYSVNGDTANIWRGAQALVLMPKPGFNSYQFTVKVDTTFHVGDRFQLMLNASYIIQEGTRNAVAVIAATMDNDSTISQVLHMSSDSRQTLIMGNLPPKKVKALRGYIIFPSDNNTVPSTTLKILCLTNIQLLKIHQPKGTMPNQNGQQPIQSPQGPPTMQNPQGPTTIQRPNTTPAPVHVQ